MQTHWVMQKAKELIDKLPYAPPEAKAEKLRVFLCNVEPKALLVALAATPLDGKADTWPHTREMQTKTHCLSLQDLNTEAISVPLGEVKATKVLITWLTQ